MSFCYRLQPGLGLYPWTTHPAHAHALTCMHTHVHTHARTQSPSLIASVPSHTRHAHPGTHMHARFHTTHTHKYTLTGPHCSACSTLAHSGLCVHTHRAPADTTHKYPQAHAPTSLCIATGLFTQGNTHAHLSPLVGTQGHCTPTSPPRLLVQTERTKCSLDRDCGVRRTRAGCAWGLSGACAGGETSGKPAGRRGAGTHTETHTCSQAGTHGCQAPPLPLAPSLSHMCPYAHMHTHTHEARLYPCKQHHSGGPGRSGEGVSG